MGTRRRIERRLEAVAESADDRRRAEIGEEFRRLTVRELAILAVRYPAKDNRYLSREEQEILTRFQNLVDEAEQVFEHPEIIKLVEEAVRNNRSHIQRELRAKGVEPWASSKDPF